MRRAERITLQQESPTALVATIDRYKAIYAMADWAYEQDIALRWRRDIGTVVFKFQSPEQATLFLMRFQGVSIDEVLAGV